jgi:predicted nucleic acid-binding protein
MEMTMPSRPRTRSRAQATAAAKPDKRTAAEAISHSHAIIAQTEVEIRESYRRASRDLLAEYDPLIRARRERDGREEVLTEDV